MAEPFVQRLERMTPLQRAVFALKETQARLDALERQRSEPIAIIGMACRLPGGARDAASYWRLMCDRVDAIREMPADRWNVDAYFDPDPTVPGKMNTRWGGFLDRVDEFDNHFFGISDQEAARIDPQQRILLELAWEALEDAGLPARTLRGTGTGVFIGISASDYGMLLCTDRDQTDGYAAAGTSLCLAANRVSFALGLHGPSMAIDTACSSSLVAIHLACQNIRNGECEIALAGGVNVLLSPVGMVNLTKAGISAPDGRVRSFDAKASGYARSEGAGMVILKPLSAALQNHDPIHAVILGSAVNQNGTSNGQTAPSRPAQEQVLRAAYSRARVSPGQIQYVETHGTGTRLGDAIEAFALGTVLSEGRGPDSRCVIGSVKTNLGHLEAASGVASVIKATLALEHRQVPPNLHFQTPSPDIPFDKLPLRVPRDLEPWPETTGPRLAGVSAFGFGGSNAHLVLQEAPAAVGWVSDPTAIDSVSDPSATAPLSDPAGTRPGSHAGPTCSGSASAVVTLRARPGRLGEPTCFLLPLSARTEQALRDLAASYIAFLQSDPPDWRDICYTAAQRRDHHDCRLVLLADSPRQAIELLETFLDRRRASCQLAPDPRIMSGRRPYGRNLKIALLFDTGPEHWKPHLARLTDASAGLSAELEKIAAALGRTESPESLWNQENRWADPAYAATALLMLQLALSAWWRSVGIAPESVLGRGVGELAAASAAGILSADEALGLVAAFEPLGKTSEVSKTSDVSVPVSRAASLPFLSAVDGRLHRGPNLGASHWQTCLRNQSGWPSALGVLRARRVDVCLEIGAGRPDLSLSGWTTAEGRPAQIVSSLQQPGKEGGGILAAVGALYAAGADIRWNAIAPSGGQCVRVPTYPWQRQRLWAAKPLTGAVKPQAGAAKPQAVEATRPRPDLTVPYVAPRNPVEEEIARAWRDVLHLEQVGVHDSFFELGGDSLQVTVLLNRLRERLAVAVPLREVYESPTIARLAEHIAAVTDRGAASGAETIPRVPRDGVLLPSLTQEALWFLDQMERERPTYTIYSPLRIRGRLNAASAERALNEISARHEILRTTFPEVDGRPVQAIAPPEPRPLTVVDLSHLPEAERKVELERRISEEMERPVDLQKGPLIRITLFRLAEEDHVAILSTHHIIYDGWSMAVLLRELTALYVAFETGQPSPLAELPIQYADFAAWQRKRLEGERLEPLRNYWREQLAGVAPLELPTDHPRPAVRTTRGAVRTMTLSPKTGAAVSEFCRREGVTPFMAFLAALEVLLHRYSGRDDFAIGSPVANRTRPETEQLIGYFVNVLVLRGDLSGGPTFRELLQRTRRTTLAAYEHQEMTLDQVVDAVNPPRDLGRHPLFQVMFALQNFELAATEHFGLTVAPLEDGPTARLSFFDLTLELWPTGETFRADWYFATDLFGQETIDRMAGQYEMLLVEAVADPDRPIADLPLVTDEERRRILVQWNDTARDFPRDQCVHELFTARAERTPDAVAVVLGDVRWTYRELNERSDQLARLLQARGVGPEVRVGICLERSPELLMAILGVLKAGGAYVPLDPAYTREAAERVAFVLEESRVALVVTNDALADSLTVGNALRGVPGSEIEMSVVILRNATEGVPYRDASEQGGLDAKVSEENLAYILYTSGSTGRPKGVMVTHGNLVNAYYGWEEAYRLPCDVHSHLQMASFGFDVFGGDMVRALCSGGKLVICPKEILLDPEQLLELMRREKVDIAEFVPAVFRELIKYAEENRQSLDFLRLAIVGSDAWYAADHKRARRVLGANARLVNSYGLTEATIDSSYFEGDAQSLPDAALVPIGRPFANVRLYVLDQKMRPAPVGVPGELYIGGRGVSRGYVNAELNAERFPEDPFGGARFQRAALGRLGLRPDLDRVGTESQPTGHVENVPHGTRLCRTGDRARWRVDGQVEFLGRADNQVKIRGFRVEPGEVEQLLREHPQIAETAVAVRERTPGDLRLVAYLVGKTQSVPDLQQMRRFLGQRLPEYMIPSAFVTLSAIPMTASGKVDRRALPEPDWSRSSLCGEFVAPRTDAERQLAAIWSEVLSIERIGVHDNFFELGGNSLMALRLTSRVRSAMAVDLPLVTLFTAPTVAGLAEAIDRMRQGGLGLLFAPSGIDWKKEAELDPSIRVVPEQPGLGGEPSRVFLTGASGFLGAFLLRELLVGTRAAVYCLVRARSDEEARDRILRNLAQYDLPFDGLIERIVPVCGDLAQPLLGLSDERFHALAAEIDAVYHNGAQMNLLYPYPMLKAANVQGTMEVLRLATRTKTKPVHFVSTVSVFDAPEHQAEETIDESRPPEIITGLAGGYALSKCVAEMLVRAAGARGLPFAVYRPGRITGDSATGAANAADQMTMLLKLCVDLGAAPAIHGDMDMTPVDYVARAIVSLSRRRESVGKTFHLLNPQPIAMSAVYRAIRSSGCAMEELPFSRWRSMVAERAAGSGDRVLAGLSDLLSLQPAADIEEALADPSRHAVRIECAETLRALQKVGVSCPRIDEALLVKYLGYLKQRGTLAKGLSTGHTNGNGKTCQVSETSAVCAAQSSRVKEPASE